MAVATGSADKPVHSYSRLRVHADVYVASLAIKYELTAGFMKNAMAKSSTDGATTVSSGSNSGGNVDPGDYIHGIYDVAQ